MSKRISFIFLLIITSLYTACANLTDTKTATISFFTNSSRAATTTINDLTDISLIGTHNGKDIELGSWKEIANLNGVEIEIQTGTWDFTLKARDNKKLFEGNVNNFLIEPGNNLLSFSLELVNPLIETTSDKLNILYSNISTKEVYKNKTIDIKLTDIISTVEQWSTVKSALKNQKNGVSIALQVKFGSNFNYNDLTQATNTPADKESPIIPIALKEVTILPETNKVGDFIFNNCSNLSKVTVYGNPQFGDRTFDKCRLSFIDFKGSLKQWCESDHYTSRFYPQNENYTVLIGGKEISNTLIIDENINSIGNGAFKYFTKLESVTFPNKALVLGEHSFAYCNKLDNVTIPDEITSLPKQIFYQCNNLKTLTFNKERITNIGYSALSYTGLNKFEFPTQITTIQGGVLKHCTSLTEVILPTSTTSINAEAFLGCTNLKSLTIPDAVTKIGKRFVKGSGVETLQFPQSLTNNLASWIYTISKTKPEPDETGELTPEIIGTVANFTSPDIKYSEAELKQNP